MSDKSQMVMAGLWDEWTDKKTGERVKSCTIITCPPNALIGTLHDRMPVILAEEDWAKWLGEEPATNDELKALLVPFKGDKYSSFFGRHRNLETRLDSGRQRS